jgi:tetratricopeptide (TPR) repeat protein
MEPRRAPVAALAVEHVESSSPPAFKLTRVSDGKALGAVALPSPYAFPVEGRPASNLMRELRWYLEGFLDYPFPPETIHADHVLEALKTWGTQAFDALFDRRDAGEWFTASKILQVRSDDPHVLSWPWEALHDPQAGGFLAHQRRVERRLNQIPDPPPLAELPNERVNILLVIARPYEDDVRYRSIGRPLVELIQSRNLPAQVAILRPPTFDQLREHLRTHPGHYHVLHFDGHGAYGEGADQYSPDRFRARQGCLVFENEKGEADPKSAQDLSALLREHAVPVVVLNACQSGTLDDKAEDAFATVATALLRSGMRSVVAMAHSLYVSGAKAFLPAFYRGLFESRSVAEGVRAGRQQMLSSKKRMSAAGPYEFEDWLVPVLYQQAPLDFDFAVRASLDTRESRLPQEVLDVREEYGFIGRDGPILEMERALHRKAPCIFVRGLGGVGKTTLARGFLRWLDETGGLDSALWFDFRDIRTAEFVLNRTGERFYGKNFGAAPNKLDLLARAFKEYRVLMVWDNFESAAGNLSNEDRSELRRFLDAIRGERGKVIMTSRSGEEWLGPSRRFEILLRGLDGEERWEYCEIILRELGKPVDQKDPELKKLMDQLAGHPLAMRVVLQKLERMPVASVAGALRDNIVDLGLRENDEGRLFATLRFVEQELAENLRPVMSLVGLHESYLDANLLEVMAKQVDPEWTRALIDQLMTALGTAGLLRDIGNATYQMHPLLTSYLRSRGQAPEACQRPFVDIMARVADKLALRPHHEQRVPFLYYGANFHYALRLSGNLAIDTPLVALTQSLASHAQNSRNFVEASRLLEQLCRHAAARRDPKLEAVGYRQLGIIAGEQRDLETAQEWHLKSLAISQKRGDLQGESVSYRQLGMIAGEKRDFETARKWVLKSLAISETQSDQPGSAACYHQLGILAQGQRDFETAREWHLKSAATSEKHRNLQDASGSYHELGIIAQGQREFGTARAWYLKSLAVEEKYGNLHGIAMSYHQLGRIAEEQQDFGTARGWYLKSLTIKEKLGDLYGAAITCHQLGVITQAQQDFETASRWYLRSLSLGEKQGNLHGTAITYGQLGILQGLRGHFEESGTWLIRAVNAFLQTNDQRGTDRSVQNFLVCFGRASSEGRQNLEAMWREANLGSFPPPGQ